MKTIVVNFLPGNFRGGRVISNSDATLDYLEILFKDLLDILLHYSIQ